MLVDDRHAQPNFHSSPLDPLEAVSPAQCLLVPLETVMYYFTTVILEGVDTGFTNWKESDRIYS